MTDKGEPSTHAEQEGSPSGGAAGRRTAVLPTGMWEAKAAVHMGSKSSALPPEDGKRRASRRGGDGSFKRAGWAAMDEEPTEAAKSTGSKRSHKKGEGTGRGSASKSKEPAANGTPGGKASGKKAAKGTPGSAQSEAGQKRPRELFPDAAAIDARMPPPSQSAPLESVIDDGEGGAATETVYGVVLVEEEPGEEGGEEEALGEPGPSGAATADGGGAAPPKKKRNRGKKYEEGDAKEIKPRHLKGKRKEEMATRHAKWVEAAAARRTAGAEEPSHPHAIVQQRLARLLRPKLRRWAMYEWFCSPVDHGWYADNEFARMLQAAGLGHVTRLARREWSAVRGLFGTPRRLSAKFLGQERAKLSGYRAKVRELRKLQAANSPSASTLEAELGLHGTAQLAVGQRVTAFHPKERHLYTGTVLTPDGDHYRVQFDKQKQGVQLVHDVAIMPLLDGSRGIDFTSPHSQGPGGDYSAADVAAFIADGGGGGGGGDGGGLLLQGGEPGGGGVELGTDPNRPEGRTDARELQLVAYTLRLLERNDRLARQLKRVCAEAEDELRRRGKACAADGSAATGAAAAASANATGAAATAAAAAAAATAAAEAVR